MRLVQVLLPLRDPAGAPFPRERYDAFMRELTERFGGVTAYARAPATGLWKDASDQAQRDDVVVFEVMVEALDTAWWAACRRRLESELRQQEIVIRTLPMERI